MMKVNDPNNETVQAWKNEGKLGSNKTAVVEVAGETICGFSEAKIRFNFIT
jgi:hypothetical protein